MAPTACLGHRKDENSHSPLKGTDPNKGLQGPQAAWPVFEASSQPDAAAGLLDGVARVGGDEEIDLGDD